MGKQLPIHNTVDVAGHIFYLTDEIRDERRTGRVLIMQSGDFLGPLPVESGISWKFLSRKSQEERPYMNKERGQALVQLLRDKGLRADLEDGPNGLSSRVAVVSDSLSALEAPLKAIGVDQLQESRLMLESKRLPCGQLN